LVVHLLAPPGAIAESELGSCIPTGMEDTAVGLIADPGFYVELDGGVMFTRIRLEQDEVRYVLTVATNDDDAPALANVVLHPRGRAKAGELTTASFVVRRQVIEDSGAVRAAVDAAVAGIVARDTGSFYQPCVGGRVPVADVGDPFDPGLDLLRAPIVLSIMFAAGLFGLWSTRPRRSGRG
jgi:hypothetical protein